MTWTKEEIMAYVDGQLPQADIERIEKAINEDTNANNFYENLIESNELINLSYRELENLYSKKTKSTTANQTINTKIKSLKSGVAGALAIPLKGILAVAIFGLFAISFAYQVGKNSKSLIEQKQVLEMQALNNIIKNKSKIQKHIQDNNLNDLSINFDDNSSATIKFLERSIENNNFCQKFVVAYEGMDYNINTCSSPKEKEEGFEWKYRLEKKLQ